jgi:hypothetical protein
MSFFISPRLSMCILRSLWTMAEYTTISMDYDRVYHNLYGPWQSIPQSLDYDIVLSVGYDMIDYDLYGLWSYPLSEDHKCVPLRCSSFSLD